MALTAVRIKNVSRYIQEDAARMLWAVSGGLCEFRGCTNRLFRHHVTKENINLSEKAHIYAFSEGGKRYSRLIPRSKINDIDNLMLVCESCHKLIDSENTDYSAESLIEMKKEHEERILLLTSIKPNLQSEVIIYNCNIANRCICIKDFDAMQSIIPDHYPARNVPINLSPDLKLYDSEGEFWSIMSMDLERRLVEHEPTIRNKHISLFAIAPQPLLFKLGTLLNRNYDVSVRQPQGNVSLWRWSDTQRTIDISLSEEHAHCHITDKAVITIEISSRLSDEELNAIFSDCRLFRITSKVSDPMAIKSNADLLFVVSKYREALNRIRLECVAGVKVNLLMIAPASVSIEAGRQLMKGDPAVVLYDRNFITKEWAPTLSLNCAEA